MNTEILAAPYRAIFTEEGNKIDLRRQYKLTLGYVDEEGFVYAMTPAEFLASDLEFQPNKTCEDEIVRALMKAMPLNRQIEVNGQFKKLDHPTFDAKLEILLTAGAKLTKRGLKF